jgi:hypothetical protein
MKSLPELGKTGIAFTGNNYQGQTEYIFTRLKALLILFFSRKFLILTLLASIEL